MQHPHYLHHYFIGIDPRSLGPHSFLLLLSKHKHREYCLVGIQIKLQPLQQILRYSISNQFDDLQQHCSSLFGSKGPAYYVLQQHLGRHLQQSGELSVAENALEQLAESELFRGFEVFFLEETAVALLLLAVGF